MMEKLKRISYPTKVISQNLAYVQVKGDMAQATDGYRFVRVKNRGYKRDGFYHSRTGRWFSKVEDYPNLDKLADRYDSKDMTRVTVGRRLLIQMLEALERDGEIDEVTIEIDRSPIRPMWVRNINGFGMIMPINKQK